MSKQRHSYLIPSDTFNILPLSRRAKTTYQVRKMKNQSSTTLALWMSFLTLLVLLFSPVTVTGHPEPLAAAQQTQQPGAAADITTPWPSAPTPGPLDGLLPTRATRTRRPPTSTYPSCGGFRATPVFCPEGSLCIDDPWAMAAGSCGMACDAPGICVVPGKFCGGFAGLQCEDGKVCVDDPRDNCWPGHGGYDCGGFCV